MKVTVAIDHTLGDKDYNVVKADGWDVSRIWGTARIKRVEGSRPYMVILNDCNAFIHCDEVEIVTNKYPKRGGEQCLSMSL